METEIQSWANLATEVGSCRRCTLCDTPGKRVFGEIKLGCKVVFIGEGPGSEESAKGMPFIGASGKLLRNWAVACGLKEEEYSIFNVINCPLPGNRKPMKVEMTTCGVWLQKQLQLLGCKKIVLLGAVAAEHMLEPSGYYLGGVMKYVGSRFTVGETEFLVMPHPSYVLRAMGSYDPPIDKMKQFVEDD